MKLTPEQINSSVADATRKTRQLSAALSGALSDLHAHNRDNEGLQLASAPLQAAAHAAIQAADFLQRHAKENTNRLNGLPPTATLASAAPGAPKANPLRSMLDSAANMFTLKPAPVTPTVPTIPA